MAPSNDIPDYGYLRLPQILKIFPVSKSTWWAGVKSGRFPKSVKLGANTTAWRAEDIHALIRETDSNADTSHQPDSCR
jgi:predicted DNA-binding transcriptional regulator AlpA